MRSAHGNQTPWRHLEREGAGWDLNPEDDAGFRSTRERLVEMDEDAHRKLRRSTTEYGNRVTFDPQALDLDRGMLAPLTTADRLQRKLLAGRCWIRTTQQFWQRNPLAVDFEVDDRDLCWRRESGWRSCGRRSYSPNEEPKTLVADDVPAERHEFASSRL